MTNPTPSTVLPSALADRFVASVRSVLLPSAPPIALHEPVFGGNEWVYVKECIDTGWVSSVGKYVDEFERKLAEVTGSRFAIATSSGTSALHVALKLAGVETGEEVLVPALSFVATANSVSHCGAVPHFVDSCEKTIGLDPLALRDYLGFIAERSGDGVRNKVTGRRLAAIVPMHAFGHPVDLDGLLALSHDYGIPIVEDAAESLGSLYHGRHTGTFGMLSALSFNGNKIVTTGGGGAILTQDAALARRAKHITTTAKRPHRWEFFHDEVAWNYRLPNINAALGCAQLERLNEFVQVKRALAERYINAFADDQDFQFVKEPPNCHSNYWLGTAKLRVPSKTVRDELLAAANDAGFMVRPVWTLLNQLPMYKDCPVATIPVAQRLADSIVNLPSGVAVAKGATA
jgi:perosamine synthetase